MLKQTSLYNQHQQLGGMLIDFNGWAMPLHYGSQIAEHHHVRREVGMFDVSHMTVTDFTGEHVQKFLRYILANDIMKMYTPGQALYSCLLSEQGGVIDDLIVYWMGENYYRIVSNAGTREKDRQWFRKYAESYEVKVKDQDEVSILAVQGPQAQEKIIRCYPSYLSEKIKKLVSFRFYHDGDIFISKTGYTGEEGFELIVPNSQVVKFWESLLELGVHPCGLGARDTLRLEAGMNLYGQDMDITTTPYESGLTWTVSIEPNGRYFEGRRALELEKFKPAESKEKLVGLVLLEKGVLRRHQKIYDEEEEIGEITSGSFSPTLNCSIAFARVREGSLKEAKEVTVLIRDKKCKVKVVKPPFVRKGQRVVDL